ncbi:MAG: hypothetical protein ACSHXY_05290 [Alphaproteobacteria bacterium]
MKFILFPTAFMILSIFTGCGPTSPPVGDDRDGHGCIGSAGYVWSEAKQKCLRLWEEGLKLVDVQNPSTTSAAYLVVDDSGGVLELFPLKGESRILGTNGYYAVKSETGLVRAIHNGEGMLVYSVLPAQPDSGFEQ